MVPAIVGRVIENFDRITCGKVPDAWGLATVSH
jgi:hypothetical protein